MPTAMPVSAPAVLKRRQLSASSSGGKFALAANTNATLTSTVTLKPAPISSVATIAASPTASAATRPAARSFSSLPRLEHVRPQVVGDRARRGEHEARHDGQDRRERGRAEQRERDVAAGRAVAAEQRLGE